MKKIMKQNQNKKVAEFHGGKCEAISGLPTAETNSESKGGLVATEVRRRITLKNHR